MESKFRSLSFAVLAVSVLTACSDSDSNSDSTDSEATASSNETSDSSVFTSSTVIDAGNVCAAGGIEIDMGFDTNGNETLDDDEVIGTETVCNGEDGQNGSVALVTVTSEAAGDSCSLGGLRVDAGVDTNDNDTLDTDEITATEYVCNGIDGEDANELMTVSNVEAAELETLSFTLTLSDVQASDMSFYYGTLDATAEGGADYESVAGTVTFVAGETEKTVSVALNSDAQCEGSEYFVFQVSGEGANVSGFGTITDVCDVDSDDDGLVDIHSLEQLDWMRNDVTGGSLSDNEGNSLNIGCPDTGCNGYELMKSLDFDTNSDDVLDAKDDFYNAGSGWEPIGNSTTAFSTNFEGNGYTISNLMVTRTATNYVGLFGYVDANNAEISFQNINFEGDLTSVYGDEYVGTLAGYVTPNETGSVNINSVHVEGNVSREGSSNMGGLIGRFEADIDDNTNSVALQDVSFVGTLNDDSGSSYNTGGIIGKVNDIATFTLSDCSVEVTMNLISGDDANLSEVGAVIGELSVGDDGVSDTATIERCEAQGSVAIDQEYTAMAGFIGAATVEGTSSLYVSYISTDFDIDTAATDGDDLGGLFGTFEVQDNSVVEISHSHTSGELENAAGSSTGGLMGGGYIESGSVSIASSSSIANVYSSDGNAGGLIGFLELETTGSSIVIENSFATGTVEVGDDDAGGLIGELELDDSTAFFELTNNYTLSGVTATSNAGNLIGLVDGTADNVSFTENYFLNETFDDAIGTGDINVTDTDELNDLVGVTLDQTKCPVSAGDTSCSPVIYSGWSSIEWDFGTTSQLPGLITDSVTYRDNNLDGVFDE